MNWRFVVKEDAGGSYRFHLLAEDGQIIASSHAYDHKPSVFNAIESIRRHAADAPTSDQSEQE